MKAEYVVLRLRNALGFPFKPEKVLSKIRTKKGQTVLDYGCGIGSFTLPLADLVGENGKVIALDMEPSAIQIVEKVARRKNLTNITTVQSDCGTNLDDQSVDTVLFIGVLPYLQDPLPVLRELHRVLKPDGLLVSRHCFRISREEVLKAIQKNGLFKLQAESGRLLSFTPI